MAATKATLAKSLAATESRFKAIYRRIEDTDRPPTETVRRTALDLAAELGVALDPWQQHALTTATHDILLLVTRQGGKGEVATFLALDQLVNVPGSTTVVVSRADRQARRLLRRIKRRYRQLADVPPVITDNVEQFALRNGAEVIALPGSEETTRGIEAVDLLVVDEAILVPDDLFTAVYPMLATTDGRCVAMTTARPFWNWFRRAWESDDADWHREKITWRQIPRFRPEFIERVRRRLTEAEFAEEFECVFSGGEGSVFRRVAEAATAQRQDGPIEGHTYLISIDWGDVDDWTVLAVWDATWGHLVALDRFQRIGYPLQLARLQALCERFRPAALAPERNSMGDPIIQQIALEPWCPPEIWPFTTTNASKALAVKAFALALERDAVKIVEDPVLVGELHAFRGTRLPSGLIRYGAPEGVHDDCCMAAIIGYWTLYGGMETEQVIVHDDDPIEISPI